MALAKVMGSKSGVVDDIESLRSLVQPNTTKITRPEEKEVLKGSVKRLTTEKRSRGSSLRQVFYSLFANIGTVNTGLMFGFSAVAIPQLISKDSLIKIEPYQVSWIASLSSITTPIGCLLSGFLMDVLGRKRTLIITQIPTIIGWLTIAAATQVEMIYIGRLLVGLGSGLVGAPSRVYTSEVTQPHMRGMLAATASVGVSLGVMIEYIIGSLYTWPVLALISSLIPMLALIGSLCIPESPSWLLSHGRVDDCKNSLLRLRGATCNVDKEMQDLVAFSQRCHLDHTPSAKETFQAIFQPSAIKPFIILSLYFIIYQFSGVNPVTFYAVSIFEDSGAGMNKNLATVILGIIRLLFTIVSCIVMRRCGRRPLTFISSVFCGLSMMVLGTYMFAFKSTMTWLPLVSIFIFIAASTIGYLVVPWVMIGELYPTKVRGIIGGLTTCVAHFSVFLVVKTFQMFQELIGKHGVYWFYGMVSLTGTVFFYLYLPETKGKSLQEIEDYFSGRIKSLKQPKKVNNKPIVLKPSKGDLLP